MFLPHPHVNLSIVGSLRDREVACSAWDRQGSNFETCVWRTVSSHSAHHPQEVLLAQFSLYVHKGGLKPDSFHFHFHFTRGHTAASSSNGHFINSTNGGNCIAQNTHADVIIPTLHHLFLVTYISHPYEIHWTCMAIAIIITWVSVVCIICFLKGLKDAWEAWNKSLVSASFWMDASAATWTILTSTSGISSGCGADDSKQSIRSDFFV